MKYLKTGLICVGLIFSLGGCTLQNEDRLTPTGKQVIIPQGQQFCNDNPHDSLCSK